MRGESIHQANTQARWCARVPVAGHGMAAARHVPRAQVRSSQVRLNNALKRMHPSCAKTATSPASALPSAAL